MHCPRPMSRSSCPPPRRRRPRSGWRKIVFALLLIAAAVFAYFRIKGNKKEAAATEAKTSAGGEPADPGDGVGGAVADDADLYDSAGHGDGLQHGDGEEPRGRPAAERAGARRPAGEAGADAGDDRPAALPGGAGAGGGAAGEGSGVGGLREGGGGRYTALYQAGVVSKESEQTQVSNCGASAGTLAADRAAIQAAKVNVAYTRITSPINGVVGLRQVDAGNIVHASDATGCWW